VIGSSARGSPEESSGRAHRRTAGSLVPAANWVPFLLKATEYTAAPSTPSAATFCGESRVRRSHNVTSPPEVPTASNAPSGLNAEAYAGSPSPAAGSCPACAYPPYSPAALGGLAFPQVRCHSRVTPSTPLMASTEPSGLATACISPDGPTNRVGVGTPVESNRLDRACTVGETW